MRDITNEELKLLEELHLNEEIRLSPIGDRTFVTPSGIIIGIYSRINGGRAYIKKCNINYITGYSQCSVIEHGKSVTKYAHRIILETWYPKPDDEHDWVCDHINENRTDNRLINLQWLTRRQNIQKRDDGGSLLKPCWIYDMTENKIIKYDSRIKGAESIDMFRSNFTKYLKLNKVVRNRYYISDTELTLDDVDMIDKTLKNQIYVYDLVRDGYRSFDSRKRVAEIFNSSLSSVTYYSRKNSLINNRYYISYFKLDDEKLNKLKKLVKPKKKSVKLKMKARGGQ